MKKIFLLISLVGCLFAYAQETDYYTGLVMDDEGYDSIAQKAELLTRDYGALPARCSLKAYCPTPGSQGPYGTCTSWATTYAARTISEAYRMHWTDRQKINSETFAPLFVYSQIDHSGLKNCSRGTCIQDALQVLKTKGAPKFSQYNYLCSCEIPYSLWGSAYNNRITDYFTLFSSATTDSYQKIRTVKKALAEHCPVVISFACWESFHKASGAWNGVQDNLNGHHAMCVVGYDDNMYGGAFEIMNSWGTGWGNNGFIWIKYDDFARNVRYALEMYVAPAPLLDQTANLAGQVRLQLSTGQDITGTRQNASLLYYKMNGQYVTGTRYRIYVSNQQPAYVYIIGSDEATRDVTKLFPSSPRISPALTYSSNNIAFPREDQYIEMDDVPGANYLCVLFCSEKQDIDALIYAISAQSGSFAERVRKGLSGKMVPLSDTKVGQNGISFSSSSSASVIPIIMEVSHR